MSIDEIRKRHADAILHGVHSGYDAHEDRGALLGLLDRLTAVTSELDDEPWQTEKPTEGMWHFTVPKKLRRHWPRTKFPACVHFEPPGHEHEGCLNINGNHYEMTSGEGQHLFVGALWLKREVPSDPFGRGGGE